MKLNKKLFEFDDFLIDVIRGNHTPQRKVLIIDEYQDSSGLQNAVMEDQLIHVDWSHAV